MSINIRLDMDNYLKDLIEDIEQMESFDCQRTFEKTQRRIRARRIRISIIASFSAAAVLAAIQPGIAPGLPALGPQSLSNWITR